MLRVKTYIHQSTVHGFGLFAAEPIPAGTVIWKYDPPFDVAFSEDCLAKLPGTAREAIVKYMFFEKAIQKFINCGDDARFMNHSETPTVQDREDFSVAARDIDQGEELTCDYDSFGSPGGRWC